MSNNKQKQSLGKITLRETEQHNPPKIPMPEGTELLGVALTAETIVEALLQLRMRRVVKGFPAANGELEYREYVEYYNKKEDEE
jgi:hypothetical protein